MQTTDTFGVHFILRQSKEVNGKAPIYVRLTVNKSRVELAIRKYLSAADWSEGKGFAKPKNEELRILNSYLEEVRSKIVTHYQRLTLREELVTASDVKDAYLGLHKDKTERTLLWLVNEHNLVMKKVLSKGSIKN